MKVLVLVLPLLVVVLAFWLGTVVGSKREGLSKSDRKELESLRTLREDLILSASEHATLGSDFAVIALSRINETRKKEIR